MCSSYNGSTSSLINSYKFFLTSGRTRYFDAVSCLKLGQTSWLGALFLSPANITQGRTIQGTNGPHH